MNHRLDCFFDFAENHKAYPAYLIRYYCGNRDPRRTPFESKADAERQMTSTCIRTNRDNEETGPMRQDHGSVQWEYESRRTWKPFFPHHQEKLELVWNSYHKQMSRKHMVRIMAGKYRYDVDISAMKQMNIDHWYHRERRIRRTYNPL